MNYFIIILFLIQNYIYNIKQCFEYSCEECESEEYGTCIRCRENFNLINGSCPCSDSSCALCETGFAGYYLCIQCKNGYYNYNNDCFCNIDNCIQCSENDCLKCQTNYYYNKNTNKCEQLEEKIKCYDSNCDICFSEEEGACEECNEGYKLKKGSCELLPKPENEICPQNYFLEENLCQEICNNLTCTISTEFSYYGCYENDCLVCQNNIIYILSNCNNSLQCELEGCLNCISKDECAICNQGYYLIGGKCKQCIKGCSLCSNSYECEYCFSGYELDNDHKCFFNNNFDYNIDLYNYYKERLIELLYPLEERNTTLINYQNIQFCDNNCLKCYQNTGECLECKRLFILKDNKCIKNCSNENCLDCKIQYNHEVCTECKKGYSLGFNNNCLYRCTINYCTSCTLNDGNEYCNECLSGYKYDSEKKICKKNNTIFYFYIIFVVIIALLFLSIFIIVLITRYRNNQLRNNYIRNAYIFNEINNNNNSNIERRMNTSGREIFENELKNEFEIQKKKIEKNNQMCQYCKTKIGKYICDCGCIVCNEHSNLNIIKENNEEKKICFVCKKVVKNINPIQNICNICFQKKPSIAHFKCGCSILVCKECYVKCKLASNKCPGCRATI